MRVTIIELKSNESNFQNLTQCCGKFFDENEKLYLFSTLVAWTGSDIKATQWFQSETISAFGGKTAFQLCKKDQTDAVIKYIRHIERGGFA
ncbi:DUF2384 domain-containing protein [Colwellia sp. BRX10-3]|uniref:antitoxin Xre/MbcA/ParS toxin-binding domain-containing protein n=1 Tax=Colwellia sp. BRX10-3 TaxID=2759844 RepID=UPI0015F3D323|nr:antitoxin Xre/MbcA/ParS toxin-binding domain-containing protein [Colwellia sp. BRX10-3]MBA6390496.1 DUF2384 domain-containing protein [Colwellia sp. BRX10-3]